MIRIVYDGSPADEPRNMKLYIISERNFSRISAHRFLSSLGYRSDEFRRFCRTCTGYTHIYIFEYLTSLCL